jgi:sugar/nucleoside kinase (ribokinase family)
MSGLKQRILNAKNESELSSLLTEGKSYEHASDKTKKQWEKAAQKRKTSFVPEPAPASSNEEKPKKKKTLMCWAVLLIMSLLELQLMTDKHYIECL